MELFVGDDWAEDHHDVAVADAAGRRLVRARLPEGVAGIARLHELVAAHLGEDPPERVTIGIETDRGPWVAALVAAGYRVFAVNPLSVARYRNRLVGILHGCLKHGVCYDEHTAWAHHSATREAPAA